MELLTPEILQQLAENGRRQAIDPDFDPVPVVKLFTPDAGATWLLFWTYPDMPDIAYGVADLGLGIADTGDISIEEIREVRGALGLPVERDLFFETALTLREIAAKSKAAGHIVAS